MLFQTFLYDALNFAAAVFLTSNAFRKPDNLTFNTVFCSGVVTVLYCWCHSHRRLLREAAFTSSCKRNNTKKTHENTSAVCRRISTETQKQNLKRRILEHEHDILSQSNNKNHSVLPRTSWETAANIEWNLLSLFIDCARSGCLKMILIRQDKII